MAPWAGKGARITPGLLNKFEVGIHANDDACCPYLYVEAKSRAHPLLHLEEECKEILACIRNDILTDKLVMDTPAAELRVERYSLEEARKKESLLTHMEPVTALGTADHSGRQPISSQTHSNGHQGKSNSATTTAEELHLSSKLKVVHSTVYGPMYSVHSQ